MALSNIEKHYNKHPEDLRLQRRHGIVEFETTMYHLRRLLRPGMRCKCTKNYLDRQILR